MRSSAADRAARSVLGAAVREAGEMPFWVQVGELAPTRAVADGTDGVGPV